MRCSDPASVAIAYGYVSRAGHFRMVPQQRYPLAFQFFQNSFSADFRCFSERTSRKTAADLQHARRSTSRFPLPGQRIGHGERPFTRREPFL